MIINSYDIDGVINMGEGLNGLRPCPNDVIITGRSFEEESYTLTWLRSLNITNKVYFNDLPFDEKTRKSSGEHKAKTLKMLIDEGYKIGIHFEDDEVQANVIRSELPELNVVLLVHDLVEKENVWHETL